MIVILVNLFIFTKHRIIKKSFNQILFLFILFKINDNFVFLRTYFNIREPSWPMAESPRPRISHTQQCNTMSVIQNHARTQPDGSRRAQSKPLEIIREIVINQDTGELEVSGWINRLERAKNSQGENALVIKRFVISGIPATDSLKRLAEVIIKGKNISLQTLCICDMEYEDSYVRFLFQLLEQNISLKSLELVSVPLNNIIIQALARGLSTRRHTQNVIIDSCGLTDATMEQFLECLRAERCRPLELDLSRNFLTSIQPKSWDRASVVSLCLTENDLGSPGASLLSDCGMLLGRLALLDVEGCEIGPEGARRLSEGLRGTSLRLLNLSRNPIGSLGVMYLADVMKELYGLRYLRLEECGVGDTGAMVLLRSVAVCKQELSLELQGNLITDTMIPSLLECCKGNSKSIDLSRNFISLSGELEIAETLEFIQREEPHHEMPTVNLMNQKQLTKTVAPPRRDQLEIEEEFWSNRDRMIKIIKNIWDTCKYAGINLNKSITRSNFDNNDNSRIIKSNENIDMKQLRDVFKALTLGFNDNNIRNTENTEKRNISIATVEKEEEEKGMTVTSFYRNEEKNFSNLRYDIKLYGNKTLMNFYFPLRIPNCICVNGMDMSGEKCSTLGNASVLFQTINSFRSLSALSLSNCQIDDNTIELYLANIIASSRHLRLLNLDNNRLTFKSLIMILEAIGYSSKEWSNRRKTEEGKEERKLVSLNLSYNPMLFKMENNVKAETEDELWDKIRHFIGENILLLDISGCNITANTIKNIFSSQLTNSSLTHLILDNNTTFGDEGLNELMNVVCSVDEKTYLLGKNQHEEEMSLSSKFYSYRGIEDKINNNSTLRIVDETKANDLSMLHLKTLSLRNCNITNASLDNIRKIVSSPILKGMFLDNNNDLGHKSTNDVLPSDNLSVVESYSHQQPPTALTFLSENEGLLQQHRPLLSFDDTYSQFTARDALSTTGPGENRADFSISGAYPLNERTELRGGRSTSAFPFKPSESVVLLSLAGTNLGTRGGILGTREPEKGRREIKPLEVDDALAPRTLDMYDLYYTAAREGDVTISKTLDPATCVANPVTAWGIRYWARL